MTIKKRSEKSEKEVNSIVLTSGILEDESLNTLSPIDIDVFMGNVRQYKYPLTSSSRYPQTLCEFNSLFKTEHIKKIKDRRIAVIYRIEHKDTRIFAVVIFENSQDDYTDTEEIDAETCHYWIYTGECYFYSPELISWLNKKTEKDSSFEDFTKECPNTELIFTRYMDPESNSVIWMTKVLTEQGVQQVVYGLKTTLEDTVGNIEIGDSKLISITEIDA